MLRSTPSYIYFTATYTITILVYSFCNIDDLTWGTKGCISNEGRSKYYYEKIRFVTIYSFSNVCLAGFLVSLNKILGENNNYVLIGLGAYATGMLFFKFVFAAIYTIYYNCCSIPY